MSEGGRTITDALSPAGRPRLPIGFRTLTSEDKMKTLRLTDHQEEILTIQLNKDLRDKNLRADFAEALNDMFSQLNCHDHPDYLKNRDYYPAPLAKEDEPMPTRNAD